jgi:hypothetical protein
VLAPLGVRRDLEPVDPERLDTEHPAHETHGASGPDGSTLSTWIIE